MEGLESLFERALRLDPPWKITRIEFDESEGIIRVFIDFPRGSVFCCPVCCKSVKAYDTTEKEWRHLSFFQYACYLVGQFHLQKLRSSYEKRLPKCQHREPKRQVSRERPNFIEW